MLDVQKTLKKNKKVENLYNEINNWKPIVFQKDDTEKTWGSHINEQEQGIISYCKTDNYLTSLAHELLHFKLQKDGYKRIRSVDSSFKNQFLARNLLTALDNEFQHHKMYPIFIDLGLDGKKFYCDDDHSVVDYLNGCLTNKNTIEDLICDYFTLIAPGGTINNSDKKNLKGKFEKKLGNNVIAKIDDIFQKWTQAKSLDSKSYVGEIYNLVENNSYTWIGYELGEKSFPDNGFFINESFERK